jgi:glucose-6-phosphate isomerase, archaeal
MSAFDPGIDVKFLPESMGFRYGASIFGPEPAHRGLNDIRASLLDRDASGPDPVYSIAMDVGRAEHRALLEQMHLLYGVVAYAPGTLGQEPVRSQGHVHALSPHSGWSTPELIEVWEGEALVYLQEFVEDDPGRCIAVHILPGEIVVIPPGWAHFVASALKATPLVFGAWCTRIYAFEYGGVRARDGLAWFPVFETGDRIAWKANARYAKARPVIEKTARSYPELGLGTDKPIYSQFAERPECMRWIAEPVRMRDVWSSFEP